MIALAENQMIPALKVLWKRSFGDTNDYIEMFFKYRFQPAQSLVWLQEGQPVSMLFMLPIRLCSKDVFYEAFYIYAVATDPDYRSKGYSSLLLEAAHQMLKEKKADACLLRPADARLFRFYADRGYQNEFFVNEQSYIFERPQKTVELKAGLLSEQIDLRNRYFFDCALYGAWDISALNYQEREMALTGGQTLCFTVRQPGYAACWPAGDSVTVKELVAFDNREAVIEAIAAHYHKNKITIRQKTKEKDTAFAMIHWFTDRPQRTGNMQPYLSLVLD